MAPTITKQSKSQVVIKGNPVTLSVEATESVASGYTVAVKIVSDPIYYNDPLKVAVIAALEIWSGGFAINQTITYAEIIAFVESIPGVNSGDVFAVSVWHLVNHLPVEPVDPIIPDSGKVVTFEVITILFQPT